MTPPPDSTHDNIVTRINRHLTTHLTRLRDQGKIYIPRAAIWTSPDTYLEPDLFYVSAKLESRLSPEHRDSADLVIEVVSPGSVVYDRNTKSDTYAALGVRELWLVDETSETVEVRNLTGSSFGKARAFKKGDKIVSEVFPHLKVPISKIFEG